MNQKVDFLSNRLVSCGWTITSVVNPSVSIEGRDLPVARIAATRDLLRAWIVFFSLTGDAGDRAWLEHQHREMDVRQTGSLSGDGDFDVRVKVSDIARARTELEYLQTLVPAFGNEREEERVDRLVRRGWRIVSHEGRGYDSDVSFSLTGQRDGDTLSLYISSCEDSGVGNVRTGYLDYAVLEHGRVSINAKIDSKDEARLLCHDLMRDDVEH